MTGTLIEEPQPRFEMGIELGLDDPFGEVGPTSDVPDVMQADASEPVEAPIVEIHDVIELINVVEVIDLVEVMDLDQRCEPEADEPTRDLVVEDVAAEDLLVDAALNDAALTDTALTEAVPVEAVAEPWEGELIDEYVSDDGIGALFAEDTDPALDFDELN